MCTALSEVRPAKTNPLRSQDATMMSRMDPEICVGA